MKPNAVLAPFTILMLGVTGWTIFSHVNETRSGTNTGTGGTESGQTVSLIPSEGRSLLKESRALMLTGVSSRVPISEDYHLLSKVPWKLSDVRSRFSEAGAKSACELLEVGVDVVQPLIEASPNTEGPLGRRSAFSIRLQLGKNQGDGLPSITKGIIEDYLRQHQLTIQPTFYHDQQGQVILSPQIRAAFVRLDTPRQSAIAEKMISESIRELRTLGAYWSSDEAFSPAACRTLILGFRYTLDSADDLSEKANAQREYELVFLHRLPESTAKDPKLAVFATSDARTQFHLLEETNPDSEDQLAAISADVIFANSAMLGMYPENPIVTKVKHQALLSVTVDFVEAQMEGFGTGPAGNFSDILDQLYARALGQNGQPASDSSTDAGFSPSLLATPSGAATE